MKRPPAQSIQSLAFACAVAWSAIASAQASPVDKAQADAFFREGRALMAAGNVAQACGKFAESQRLDPAPGTLVNLAICHEKEGKTASAWAEFNEVAERPGDDKARAAFARTRASELEKKLVRLRIVITAPERRSTVTITVDRRVQGPSAWGTALPLDPGEHEVEATAPGRKPWRQTVRLDKDHALVEVGVPELEPEAPAAAAPVATPAPVAVTAPPPEAPRGGSARIIGWTLTGVGAVLVAGGAYFGVRTLQKKSDADALCPQNKCAGDRRVAKLDDEAQTSSVLSTIGVGVGLAAIAGGLYMVLSSSSGSHVALVPNVNPRTAGATLEGHF
jgi:hypothetical protein